MDKKTIGMLAQMGITAAGELGAANERRLSAEELAQARAMFGNIPLPQLERAYARVLEGSEEGMVQADPALKAAQAAALARLGQVADSGGYDLESQAVQNRIRSDVARHESAGRNQIRNSMAARGVGGSGAELALQMAGNQNSAERASQEGMTAAGQAQKAAYAAMMGQGELAGRMRSQGFQEQSSAARARDMMRKFNAEAQTRADAYNRNIPQQQFNNQMQRTTGMTGFSSKLSDNHLKSGQDMREAGAGYGRAAYKFFGQDDVSAPQTKQKPAAYPYQDDEDTFTTY